jgi:1-acyl-sn-glycerol-3-phosphate acyltransferase
MALSRHAARALGRMLYRLKVVGLDRVPERGGVLIAVNHTAFVDGPLVYGLIRRASVFLVKDEMFDGLVGAALHRIGQIPVRRGVAERAPLQAALGTLAAGGVVGVFPEGTRGRGEVDRIEHGIAYLALRSGCPVLPVACSGTARPAAARKAMPRRRAVRVVFGEPFTVPSSGPVSRHAVTAAAEQIRLALAAHVAAQSARPRSAAPERTAAS